MKGVVGETGSLLVGTVKAAVLMALGRGIGKQLGGNIGEGLGGIVASVVQSKTGDGHKLAAVMALITVADVVHNMGVMGGGAAEGQTNNVRREM